MKKILGLLVVLFVFSCTDQIGAKPEPDDLIEKEKFVQIIKELSLVESYVQLKYGHVSRFQETIIMSGNAIFKKYKVAPKQFEASMDYYASHQMEMQDIYAQVLELLNQESSKFGSSSGIVQQDTARPVVLNIR
ncbi:MAG: DUF4296 domain-containing protein [Flavobacteriia bacterium]|jgi:hypothetical protein